MVGVIVNNRYCPSIFVAYDVVQRKEGPVRAIAALMESRLRSRFGLEDAELGAHNGSAIRWGLDSSVSPAMKQRSER